MTIVDKLRVLLDGDTNPQPSLVPKPRSKLLASGAPIASARAADPTSSKAISRESVRQCQSI
jgi:hypothetical protein